MNRINLFFASIFMLGCFITDAQNTNKGDKIVGLGLGFGTNYTAGGEGFSNSFLPVSAFMEAIVKDDVFAKEKGLLEWEVLPSI